MNTPRQHFEPEVYDRLSEMSTAEVLEAGEYAQDMAHVNFLLPEGFAWLGRASQTETEINERGTLK